MQIQIEILTKKGCGLCVDAKEIVERVLPDFPVTLKMIDIESNSDLFEKYKAKIPVVRICLLYTSPSPRDLSTSRMPSSA